MSFLPHHIALCQMLEGRCTQVLQAVVKWNTKQTKQLLVTGHTFTLGQCGIYLVSLVLLFVRRKEEALNLSGVSSFPQDLPLLGLSLLC